MCPVGARELGDPEKTHAPEVGTVSYQPSPLAQEARNPSSDHHLGRMHMSLKQSSQHHGHPAPAGPWVPSVLAGPGNSLSPRPAGAMA